jgi:hypothetical protein
MGTGRRLTVTSRSRSTSTGTGTVTGTGVVSRRLDTATTPATNTSRATATTGMGTVTTAPATVTTAPATVGRATSRTATGGSTSIQPMPRLSRRAGTVGLALTIWDVWQRIPPRHRKQLIRHARKHGPRLAARLVQTQSRRRAR